VHVCHSLTRELEVLHDQLLAQFAAGDPPTPSQIVVLLPDLPAAAPLIDAVFGTAPAPRRIPYTITGLPQTRVNPIARVLDSLLALCGSRFAASVVFDLLQQPPVAARFGMEADDLDRIHDWIRDAGIRWGLDASSRSRLDLPATDRTALPMGCTGCSSPTPLAMTRLRAIPLSPDGSPPPIPKATMRQRSAAGGVSCTRSQPCATTGRKRATPAPGSTR
jgi:hypothetical protein